MARTTIRPVTLLCQFLERQGKADGLTHGELARRIGLSPSYYGQIRTDPDALPSLSRSVIEQIARFLNQPVSQVMLWAGQLRWEDFGLPDNPSATVDQYLDFIALHIEDDPLMRQFAVDINDWSATPASVKATFVSLYELAREQTVTARVSVGAPAVTYARAGKLEPTRTPKMRERTRAA